MFRADIEGLRAVAVLLVVLAHAGVPALAGGYVGVDVFFVISGYLISSLLVRELSATGMINLARFYARRAVRLLPASTLVLVATLAATWVWLSPVRFADHARDGLAAALYAVNIRLAVADTDYFADSGPSPFQHFWSLAVEEQFYLLWPILILGTCLAARRRTPHGRRRAVLAVLGVVVVASLLVSVLELGRAAPWAYFGLHSRAWELAAGALVALGAHRLAGLPGRVAAGLGVAGLAAVLVAAVAYDETTAFPGVAAVLPVAGAAAIIAAGAGGSRTGVPALLSRRPLQWIGRLSYGWYLWHWPVLLIGPVALGRTGGVGTNLALATAALGLAFATYHLVENPVRHRRELTDRPARGLALGLTLSISVAVLALLAAGRPPALPAGQRAVDTRAVVAAAADPQAALAGLLADAADPGALPVNLTPGLAQAAKDSTAAQRDGCHQTLTSRASTSSCEYGRPGAVTTVVLFGDSHALQWFPALALLAEQHGFRLISLTRSSCSPADIVVSNARLKRIYGECATWRADALRRIRDVAPDLVVTSSATNYRASLAGDPPDPDAVWAGGWARTLSELQAGARRVVVLGDTPFLRADPVECLAGEGRPGECAEPAVEVLRDPAWRDVVVRQAARAGATFVDPVPWLCRDRCPPVVGNVLVYRDTNHLSSAYATVLGPVLGRALRLG